VDARGKIVITGGAGLVGQNLVVRLKQRGFTRLVAIDKHPANTAMLSRLHPDITVIEADLAAPGQWEDALASAAAVVVNHAQIGGLERGEFERNNVVATQRLLDVLRADAQPGFVVHISSSVVNSRASDFYTETKKAQEALVLASGLRCTVLRPTLMFGWFDRKHLGWLARFMRKTAVFPLPGRGDYVRQPLYAGDFCDVIAACLSGRFAGRTFDISGHEHITYGDIIREIKALSGARTAIVPIPYKLFWWLLRAYAVVDRDPPFTTRQLEALVIPESFPVIDWPGIFGCSATPFRVALRTTLQDPTYSNVVLAW
jgi:nucleoside-diphosphate-sugar epimerase